MQIIPLQAIKNSLFISHHNHSFTTKFSRPYVDPCFYSPCCFWTQTRCGLYTDAMLCGSFKASFKMVHPRRLNRTRDYIVLFLMEWEIAFSFPPSVMGLVDVSRMNERNESELSVLIRRLRLARINHAWRWWNLYTLAGGEISRHLANAHW